MYVHVCVLYTCAFMHAWEPGVHVEVSEQLVGGPCGSWDGTQLAGKPEISLALIFILDDYFLNTVDLMLISGK